MSTHYKTDVWVMSYAPKGNPFETLKSLTCQITTSTNANHMKKERLSHPYQLRLPPSTEKQLKKIAMESGRTMTNVMRECLVDAKPVFKGRVPIALQKDRAEALRYLHKSSNNINQVARAINTLNAKGELDYQSSIKYLYLLDTIAAHMSIIVEKFNVN